MSRNYKFYNPEGTYFVSFAVVEWLDVFKGSKLNDLLNKKALINIPLPASGSTKVDIKAKQNQYLHL